MIVAWHEVPGTAPPQKSRPVGYGMSVPGVRTDSKIGRGNFGCGIDKRLWGKPWAKFRCLFRPKNWPRHI